MTARDMFGLFVRVTAVLVMLHGLYNILDAFAQPLGGVAPSIYPSLQQAVGGHSLSRLPRNPDVAGRQDHRFRLTA